MLTNTERCHVKVHSRAALPALLALALVLLADSGVPNGEAGTPSSAILGDADCSEAVNTVDALAVLRSVAGLGHPACANLADVQCDADLDAIDALQLLRFTAGLPPSQQLGCPPIGTSLAGPVPNPLLVKVTLDTGLAVTATRGTTGGDISATAADGTTFTLTVPDGALTALEEITLTPVVSIDGLPLSGGLAGAVLIGPPDLILLKLATLTIEPATPLSDPETIGFGFHEDEFFLHRLEDHFPVPAGVSAQGALIMLPDIGPGGYGVGSGTGADREGQQGHPPTRPEDQLAQALDDIFSRHDHSSPEFEAELRVALEAYYRQGLLVALPFATTDCDVTRGLLVPYVKWLGLIQGFLGADEFAAERAIMENSLARGVANCFEESYRRCIDIPDRDEVYWVLKYLGIAQSGIVGSTAVELLGDFQAKIDDCLDPCDGADACKAFEGSASTTFTTGDGNTVGRASTSDVRFELDEDESDPGSDYWTVKGTVHWTYDATIGDCTASGSGTFAVVDREGHIFISDPDENGDRQYYASGGSPPADPPPTVTVTCPDSPPHEVFINSIFFTWLRASGFPLSRHVEEDGHLRGTEQEDYNDGDQQTWEWDFAPAP